MTTETKRLVTDAEAAAQRLAGCRANPDEWCLGSDADPPAVIGALLDTREALIEALAQQGKALRVALHYAEADFDRADALLGCRVAESAADALLRQLRGEDA